MGGSGLSTGIIILSEMFRYAQIIRERPGSIGTAGIEPTPLGASQCSTVEPCAKLHICLRDGILTTICKRLTATVCVIASLILTSFLTISSKSIGEKD